MPFQLSPGVNVSEFDLTTVIPAVASTDAAIGGAFRWGPVDKTILVDNEDSLVAKFGKPSNLNAETFFTAASFLAYGNRLHVSRAWQSTGRHTTQTTTVSAGSTTVVITGVTDSGIQAGDTVFGVGIAEGTTVVGSPTVTTDTTIVLSNAPAQSGTFELQYFDSGYSFNAIANTADASLATSIVHNEDHYDSRTFDSDVQYVAKYPGALGNSLKVSVCDSAAAFSSTISVSGLGGSDGTAQSLTFTIGSNTAQISVSNTATGTATTSESAVQDFLDEIQVGDVLVVGNTDVGVQYMQISAISAITKVEDGVPSETGEAIATVQFVDRLSIASDVTVSTSIERRWKHWNVVDGAPGQSNYQIAQGNTAASDELHVVVEDEDGKISGVPGTILEVFPALSRATDCKTEDGGTNYYKDVINQKSQYVWFANDRAGSTSTTAQLLATSTNTAPYYKSFVGGKDIQGETSATYSISALIRAYDHFKSSEDIDISLVLTGKSVGGSHGEQLANYLIDNVAEARKDCVVFCSPAKADVVENFGGDIEQDVVQFRNACRSTSYAVMDSGYKYQYDKYNDIYRWIPLNGDTAGLCAYTDQIRDAWWSPAGFNRGQIKNVVKLAWNPKKAQRDILYKNGVNPVVNFPGQGIVLFGDKTLLAKPSAFDRINVRRLFIVLEKAIATASKFTLFEFNDSFTRASFVNLVTPFLRDVQGRRGITDFVVICDETNNTGEVIDRNEFVGDIYIKPARSINFIQLNFVAVRSGVEFSEVIGNF